MPEKTYLIAHRVETESVPLEPQVLQMDEAFRQEGISRICAGVSASEMLIGAPTLSDLKQTRYQAIVNCNLLTPRGLKWIGLPAEPGGYAGAQ